MCYNIYIALGWFTSTDFDTEIIWQKAIFGGYNSGFNPAMQRGAMYYVVLRQLLISLILVLVPMKTVRLQYGICWWIYKVWKIPIKILAMSIASNNISANTPTGFLGTLDLDDLECLIRIQCKSNWIWVRVCIAIAIDSHKRHVLIIMGLVLEVAVPLSY